MIIAFLLTASLFFAICQCVHKRPRRGGAITSEANERKENRLSHHYDLQNSNSDNDDRRNSFDLSEYNGRRLNGVVGNDERNGTMRRPPNLIYSQDFSQSLNSYDPGMVYTPMTDNSNIEEEDRNEEASFIRHHIMPAPEKEIFDRRLGYGSQVPPNSEMLDRPYVPKNSPDTSPPPSTTSKYIEINLPHRRSI